MRSSEPLRPSPARQEDEPFALVEALGTHVLPVYLQLDGAASALPSHFHGSQEQRPTGAATPMLADDEELVEPGDETAVLKGPCVGQDRDAERVRVARDEHGAPPGIEDQASDSFNQLGRVQCDLMVAELRREQLDGGVEVLRSGQPNAHDVEYARHGAKFLASGGPRLRARA